MGRSTPTTEALRHGENQNQFVIANLQVVILGVFSNYPLTKLHNLMESEGCLTLRKTLFQSRQRELHLGFFGFVVVAAIVGIIVAVVVQADFVEHYPQDSGVSVVEDFARAKHQLFGRDSALDYQDRAFH